jgi:hypothetical protein
MANILSLALRVTADASGLKLDPVQRALVGLGDQADKLTGQFAKFSGGSEAAAAAQARFEKEAQGLINTLRDGGPGAATQFAAGFERLTEAVNNEAAAFERAARITEANLSPLERFDRAQAELNEQVNAGRISLETYGRATENAAKGLTDAERAARGLAVQQKEIETAADNTAIKFNELSGVFAVLPGPLGNIAGRISGIASASEGLSRIFAGGLRSGVGNLATSFTSLITPTTAALAGIAALGAGASSVVRGLLALEDRVEKLGNTADKLGVSFEFIQTLEEAANRSGTSIDAVSAAFGRLQKSVLGVDEESKAAQKALSQIGVTVEELQALSPDQQYQRIGQAIAGIEDPARRTATATALFGRAGADLIPFFNNIGGAANDMQRFGAALSETDRGNIDSLGAAFDQVGVAVKGLGQSVLLPFVGLIEGVAKAFSGLINIVTAVAQAIGTVLGPVLSTIGSVFGAFGDAVNGTVGFFRSFFSTAEEAATVTQQTADAVARTTEEVTALGKAFADSQKGLDGAIAKAGEFGQAGFDAALKFQEALADLQEQADAGELNAEQYSRGVANATAEFEKQIDVARRVADENRRLAEEADRRAQAEADAVQRIIDSNLEAVRVQQQFAGDSGRAQAAENLLRINDEFERVELRIREARANGDRATVDALTSRLAVLDQVAARESDIATGALAQRQAEAQAAAEAVAQRERLEAEARQRRLAAEQEVERQVAAERQRVSQFIDQQLALQQFGGDQARLTAAQNVAAIEQEVLRINQEIAAAKAAGDVAAAEAGRQRLQLVEQVADKEREIADGRAAQREQEQKQLADIAQQQERSAADQQRQAEQYAQQQQQQAQQALEAQRQAFEERAKQQQAEFERQASIIRQLNSVGQQTISGGDIRTTQGAQAFLATAANAFDPRVAEQLRVQKEQLKLLRALSERLIPEALGYLQQGVATTVSFLGNTP